MKLKFKTKTNKNANGILSMNMSRPGYTDEYVCVCVSACELASAVSDGQCNMAAIQITLTTHQLLPGWLARGENGR